MVRAPCRVTTMSSGATGTSNCSAIWAICHSRSAVGVLLPNRISCCAWSLTWKCRHAAIPACPIAFKTATTIAVVKMVLIMYPKSSRSMYLMEDSIPPDAADEAGQPGLLAEREVDEQRLALDVLLRHEAPVPAVLRIVAIVAHHEVHPGRHGDGLVPHPHVELAAAAFLVRRDEVMDVGLVQHRAVDVDTLVPE